MNDDFDFIGMAEDRMCSKGLSYTGPDNRSDHGHTDCFIFGGLLNHIDAVETARDHYYDACVKMEADLIELLCPALGIPNSPEYGWVIGDHTGHTLAMTLVNRMETLKKELNEKDSHE